MTKDFKETERKRIAELSNGSLYNELLDLARGDDRYGGHTPSGSITFAALQGEFEDRLSDWLDKPKKEEANE